MKRVLACVLVAPLLLWAAACRPPTVLGTATPSTPGASVHAFVIGRVQVLVAGKPVALGPRVRGGGSGPYAGGMSAVEAEDDALTAVLFEHLRSGDRYVYEIADESGRFEVLLPAGRYGITLRYDKWWSKTPAVFHLAEGGVSYYVGTLRVDLFRDRSARGLWVRTFGGAVPRGDTGFAVVDEWDWARESLDGFRQATTTPEKRLMRLESS